MAKHKNQHFVPRCYLRPFSKDQIGQAICLFHVRSRKFVQDASVKGQCSRPYLYGNNLILERALQDIETGYARVFHNVSAQSATPGDENLAQLRDFMILQSSRTEAAITRTQKMWQGTYDMINTEYPDSLPEMDLSTHNMMLLTLSMSNELKNYLTDLKICLVRNKTQAHFITSDDPVVFSNMFHAKKLATDRFGFGSTGALFFLPLSPKLLLLCYDGDAYNLSGKSRGTISLTKERDVHACNELQYLNAAHAIYLSDWKQRCELVREFAANVSRRKGFRPEFSKYVPDGHMVDSERYRKLDQNEKRDGDNMLFSGSFPRIHAFKMDFTIAVPKKDALFLQWSNGEL